MSNSIGERIRLTIFGESHGSVIGGILDGIPAGVELPLEYIQEKLNLRKAKGSISTSRQEEDDPTFLSGIHQGYTEGNAIAFILKNKMCSLKIMNFINQDLPMQIMQLMKSILGI